MLTAHFERMGIGAVRITIKGLEPADNFSLLKLVESHMHAVKDHHEPFEQRMTYDISIMKEDAGSDEPIIIAIVKHNMIGVRIAHAMAWKQRLVAHLTAHNFKLTDGDTLS